MQNRGNVKAGSEKFWGKGGKAEAKIDIKAICHAVLFLLKNLIESEANDLCGATMLPLLQSSTPHCFCRKVWASPKGSAYAACRQYSLVQSFI